MVYQMIQDSPWHIVLGAVGIVLIIAAIVIALLNRDGPGRFEKIALVSMLVIAFMCAIGAAVVSHQRNVQNDASFSKQLMDEYGVTSSRSFYEIQLDVSRFNEANTVFTKDGKDTPIFVKLVNSDGKHGTLVFTVIDKNSLYPKANK
jgi:lipopolysaccharide export LptBFGC system permease protein LptF